MTSAYYRLVQELADAATARCVRSVIRRMRRDIDVQGASHLRNRWEELCAEVQLERSVMWWAYERMVNDYAAAAERLNRYELIAIWLQTPGGEEWMNDVEERREAGDYSGSALTYCVDDVTAYVSQAVIRAAMDWRSSGLQAYLNSRIEHD